MKKLGNIICTVLIVIGAIVAISYATHEEDNTMNDMYGGNGTVIVDDEGNKVHVQYFDIGKTEKSRENEKKITAAVGFNIYTMAIIGGKYFITLKKKTKEEIKKMENTQGSDFYYDN